jgi:hypothetical protein
MRVKDYWKFTILFGVLALSLFVRWEDLNRPLNFHEEITSEIARQDSILGIARCAAEDNSPPLYQLILSGTRKLISSEDSVEILSRVLSLFFVLLAGFFFYEATTKALGKSEGIFGFLIFSLLYSTHSLATFGRSSSLHLLLSTISFFLWWRLVTGENSKKLIFLFSLISLLNLYSHYFALNLFFLQILFLMILRRRDWKAWSLSSIIPLIGFLPWFNLYVKNRIFENELFWIKAPNIKSLIAIFGSLWSSSLFFYSFFLSVTVVLFWRRKKESMTLIAFMAAFIGTIALKSYFSTSVFLPRYFVALLPIILFLFIQSLKEFKPKLYFYLGFSLFILVLNTFMLENYYQKKNWVHRQKVERKGFPCDEYL